MKIATWNVAGIRARLPNLIKWLKHEQPDIVCLQETKTVNELFPKSMIEGLGYSIACSGQKSFNGVAILSKKSPDETIVKLPGDENDEQARFVEAVFSLNKTVLRVVSLYCPNGNPTESPKFRYKLDWMERLYQYVRSNLNNEEMLVLAGDFNVIPSTVDARYPQQWVKDALFLPQTRQSFFKLCNLGFVDAVRASTDDPSYTFWDFQSGAWAKNNGIRIDHVLLSPQASDKLKATAIQRELRGWEKPSDHVPVWVHLDLDF